MDALATDKFLKRYLARSRTQRLLAAEGKHIDLFVPLIGGKQLVRIATLDGREKAVLRVFPQSKKKDIKHRQLAAELIEAHGLPAPAMLDVHCENTERLCLFVEEFIHGSHPSPADLTPAQISALADVLARFHRVTDSRFGPPGAPRARGYSRRAMRRVDNRFLALRRRIGGRVPRLEKRHVKKWFKRMAPRLDAVKAFSLIHYKPHTGNLIWRPDPPGFVLIDFTTLQFGCAAKDCVEVCHQVFDEQPDPVASFLKQYFKKAGAGAESAYTMVEPFYHAYHHLGQAAIYCHSRRKFGDNGNPFREKPVPTAWDHWERLMEIVEKNPV